MANVPPTIFSQSRRIAVRSRIAAGQRRPQPARFIIDDMVDEAIERLGFIRHVPARALLLGEWTGRLKAELLGQGTQEVVVGDLAAVAGGVAWDVERPYPAGGFDFIGCFGLLETANDLPGALIHMHRALAPGGFVLACLIGNGSLPILRRAMIEADGDRPAARLHPQVDVQAAAQLLQRAGWADPVVDSHTLTVRYGGIDSLIRDLRAQGLGNALASRAPAIGKAGLQRAREAFAAQADADGRIAERFEIITLSGRRR